MKSGGPGLFESLYADPARLKEFLAAMSGISHGANMTIAMAFPWRDYRTFVDVGTAQGDLAKNRLRQSTSQRPRVRSARGGAYLRRVCAGKRRVGSPPRFFAGSFFVDELPKADVVLMGHILHD
ncbi:MAG: methyltransferase [Vicinamibacterales bacterium]